MIQEIDATLQTILHTSNAMSRNLRKSRLYPRGLLKKCAHSLRVV